jgi:hypothetical protein
MSREILKLIILVAWAAFFIHNDFYTDLPPRHDDCMYLCLAKSLLHGTGYKDITVPSSQNIPLLAPTAFPLLLTLYWMLPAPHTMLLRIFLAALLIGGVLISYLWLKRIVPNIQAFLIVLAFSSMLDFVMVGNSVLTEILFIPLLYLSCCLYMMYEEKKSQPAGWLAVAVLVILARTRLVGGFFSATLLATFLFRRDWPKFLAGVIGIGLWLCVERYWAAASAVRNAGYMGSYMREINVLANPLFFLKGLMGHFFHFSWSLVSSMYADILFPYFYSLVNMNPIKRLIVVAVFVDSVVGVWLLCKEHRAARMPFAAALVSLVPVLLVCDATGSMYRYLFPYFPMFSVCALYPVFYYAGRSKTTVARLLPVLFASLIVINQASHTLRTENSDSWFPKSERDDLAAVHNFVSGSRNKPDIVLSPQKYYAFLKTGICAYEVRVPDDLCVNVPFLGPNRTVWAILNTAYFSPAPKPVSCVAAVYTPLAPPLMSRGAWSVCRMSVGNVKAQQK